MKFGMILDWQEAQREAQATLKRTQRAILAGVEDAGDEAKGAMQLMTRFAFKGGRLANTWKTKVYGRTSFGPAELLYSKAAEIMRHFAQATTFRNNHGKFLALPTELVGYIGNRRMRPEDLDDGPQPLRFVPPAGARQVGLLVLDNARINSRGKVRLASPTAIKRGRTASVVLFILVPEISQEQRIDPPALLNPIGQKIPQYILNHLRSGEKNE